MGLPSEDQAGIYDTGESLGLVAWLTISLLVAMCIIGSMFVLHVCATVANVTIVPKSMSRLEPPRVNLIIAKTLKLEI